MEIPANLKGLYRHWDRHFSAGPAGKTGTAAQRAALGNEPLLGEILAFVGERLDIWRKKTAGEPAPYTNDPILSTYRFCNIFREFDRQTIEFHRMLNPLRDNFPLWLLNMFYLRMVARPETAVSVGLLSFDPVENETAYGRLMATPRPRFGTPYVFPVSTILKGAYPTRELFIANHLPQIMKAIAAEISTWHRQSVHDGVKIVTELFGYNHRFLWTEVLIDVAYQFPERIDLFGRFPVGPGSAPTMARLDSRRDPSLLVVDLSDVDFDTGITVEGKPLRLSAENWEGIGCEFRKYANLKMGKGRKRIYRQF